MISAPGSAGCGPPRSDKRFRLGLIQPSKTRGPRAPADRHCRCCCRCRALPLQLTSVSVSVCLAHCMGRRRLCQPKAAAGACAATRRCRFGAARTIQPGMRSSSGSNTDCLRSLSPVPHGTASPSRHLLRHPPPHVSLGGVRGLRIHIVKQVAGASAAALPRGGRGGRRQVVSGGWGLGALFY